MVEERMEYDGNIKKKNVNFSKILNEFSKLHTYCVCKQRNLVIEIVVDFIFCWQTNEMFISHAVLEPRTVRRWWNVFRIRKCLRFAFEWKIQVYGSILDVIFSNRLKNATSVRDERNSCNEDETNQKENEQRNGITEFLRVKAV